MYQRILFPTDGSDVTDKALQAALELARLAGGTVYGLAVKEPFPYSAISELQPVPPPDYFNEQEREAVARLQAVETAAANAGVPFHGHTVEALHPWEAILAHARFQRCDVVVMGSHGRRGINALLLGSETQQVVSHGHLPVLIVR
ncbi:MAG: universal stress protein [Rubrivivax sp.]